MLSGIRNLVNSENGLLDRSIFVDKDVYQQELEQVFGRCWLFVGHESQVKNNNDFTANYMGEDPVLLTRDSKGKLHAFLNMCRHRGNRICRADFGNAPSFMCTYHGWTFATDGKLVGVPGYKEAYFEELDRTQWGLVEARVETYKGLVFATWDASAPKLIDYLGDYAWYMDVLLDRRAGGTEVAGGVHRWVMNMNWKFGADNFAGDGYHVSITHGSTRFMGDPSRAARSAPLPNSDPNRVHVTFSYGHGWNSGFAAKKNDPTLAEIAPDLNSQNAVAREYFQDTYHEAEQRLGPVRAKMTSSTLPGQVFPTFTWFNAARVWHPRGPEKTELWSYSIVDKDAPEAVKKHKRIQLVESFGPAGNLEEDDGNNFVQCTTASKSLIARKYPINQNMGNGHEWKSELAPGLISPHIGEANQRALYARWAEIMSASIWDQIKIEPRTWVKG